MDQLARLRTDDGRADGAAAHDHDLDEARGFTCGDGPVVAVILGPDDLQLRAMFLARLRLGQADLRQFRVGIGGPGQMRGTCLGRQAQHGRAG